MPVRPSRSIPIPPLVHLRLRIDPNPSADSEPVHALAASQDWAGSDPSIRGLWFIRHSPCSQSICHPSLVPVATTHQRRGMCSTYFIGQFVPTCSAVWANHALRGRRNSDGCADFTRISAYWFGRPFMRTLDRNPRRNFTQQRVCINHEPRASPLPQHARHEAP